MTSQAATLWSDLLLRAIAELRELHDQQQERLDADTAEDFSRLFDGADRLETMLADTDSPPSNHDLMNVLAAIRGYSEMLREDIGASQPALDGALSRLLKAVQTEIEKQLRSLSRADYIRESLAKAGFAVLVRSVAEAVRLCNDFAPEHLSLIVKDEAKWLKEVRTAGAIYLGNDSPVAVGDFLAGPSHTLPTGGAGKSFSGLRADQFQRRTSVVKMTKAAAAKSLPTVQEFARVEGLDAHGESVRIRTGE